MTENLNRQPDLLQHQTARSRLSLSFSSHAKSESHNLLSDGKFQVVVP
jgi:hypothetical protein